MKKMLLLLVLPLSIAAYSQADIVQGWYVAAKNGLSMRDKPDAKASVLGKIPYGTKISTVFNTGDEIAEIVTEGMKGRWIKTTFNGKTGYIVSSYLLPVAPPKAGTKTMKDYFKQLSAPSGPAIMIKRGNRQNITENFAEIKKQIYKNGFEYHESGFYEAHNDAYFLPDFTIEQGFLLVRLLEEFKDVFSPSDELPDDSKTIAAKDVSEDSKSIKVYKLEGTTWINRITVEYSSGAYYTFEMFELGGQLVISFGGGV